MCRSRCAGILQRALRGPLAATGQQAPGFWAQKSSNCWASEPAAGAWPLDAESLPEGACVPPPVVPVPVEAVPLLGVWSAAPVEAPAVALAVADAVAVALGVAVAVAAGFSAAPVPGTVIGTAPPGTSSTVTFEPPQPATVSVSTTIGAASRKRDMRPPLSGAARPSGGRTSGSR